ncbi:Imm57 family immunity protein [Pseudomonas batumici]|uniref:Imm57 family immunity protein n=1 Tax=Pseudomonas batumici TaxID=226910 RepID=UPI0030D3E5C2
MINGKKAVTLLLTFFSAFAMAENESREMREIKMADDAVFWALVASVSEEGRIACSQNALACSGDRAELGLALLGGRKSPESLKAFASMLKYKLDAGLSEDFMCYALGKGHNMSRELTRIKPDELRSDCEQKLKKAEAASPSLLRGVDVNSICSTDVSIREISGALADGVKHSKRCSPGDF